jgi:hypothetical protein
MTDIGLIPNVPTSIPFPVYGITRPLYRLWCYIYTCGEGDLVLSCHRSAYYEQKMKKLGEDAPLFYNGKLFPAMILAQSQGSEQEQAQLYNGTDHGPPKGHCLEDLLVIRPWEHIKPPLPEKQKVTIDGVPFVGLVQHYRSPALFTYVAFGSLATSIRANFYGPSLEEVFEILSNLIILNSKEEE